MRTAQTNRRELERGSLSRAYWPQFFWRHRVVRDVT